MYYSNKIHQAKNLVKHYWQASSRYQIHSPMLFHIMNALLRNNTSEPIVQSIEQQRKDLIESKEYIDFVEYGAGRIRSQKPINLIAKTSLSSIWQCQVMYKLVAHLQPRTILEIGTSLGISTAYLAAASKRSNIVSLEGNPNSANIARQIAKKLELDNIKINIGNFEDTLLDACHELEHIDLAFIDGNHKKTPTLQYFETILSYCSPSSIIIVDDIYWSSEMTDAWEVIKNHTSVKATIDLYYFAIVWLNPEFLEKTHIKYINSRFKPWQKYLPA